MIIGFGLPRTGTTSLALALKILGYETLHYCPLTHKDTACEIAKLLKCGNFTEDRAIVSASLTKWISKIWTKDIQFIYCRRDLESWETSMLNMGASTSLISQCLKDLDELILPYNCIDMNIIGGDGWDKLCDYLLCPIPDQEFPHTNKSDFNYQI